MNKFAPLNLRGENMAVKEKMVGDIAVLSVSGKLMGGRETNEVHAKLKSLILDATKKVVIDLSKVKWLNSQGFGMLMACHTSLKNSEGEFKIAGASAKMKNLMMVTRLNTIFQSFETVDEAVASFE